MLTKGEKRIVASVLAIMMSCTTVFSAGFVSHAEEIVQSQEMTVEAGKAYETQIWDTDEKKLYEFIPEKTGTYQFYSVGDEDTYGYLYDSEKKLMASANDGGDGLNFCIDGKLEAGKTYYLAVGYFLEQTQGTICWQIDYKGETQMPDIAEEAEQAVTEQTAEEIQSEEVLTEQDYEYVIQEDGTASITKYTGADAEIVIPDSVNGLTVSSIGKCAFLENETLTKVTIPKSVTSLQYEAFFSCTNLKNVEFEAGSKLQTIDDMVFSDCENLETFICPEELEIIGTDAFSGCTMLESIQFNDNLKKIDRNAFWDTGLKSVTFPSSMTTIEETSFGCCYSLSSVELSNVVEIKYGAFEGCENLEIIQFPDTLEKVGGRAFESTKWFSNQEDGMVYINTIAYAYKGETPSESETRPDTSVDIKEGTTKISDYAFYGMRNLIDVTIPSSVSEIGEWAFSYTGLKKVALSDSLKTLGTGAFSSCSSLKEVETGNGITEIPDYAFNDCGLETLIIGNNVKSIGYGAFEVDLNLKEVTIPKNVTSIAYGAFGYCKSLETITISGALESLSGRAFAGTKWYEDAEDGIVYIGNFVYGYKGEMPENTSLDIKEGTEQIAEYAFEGYSNLNSVLLPDSVTGISDYAFSECSNMKSMTIPQTVTRIGENAVGMQKSDNWRDYEAVPDFAIYGDVDSAAETYADEYGLKFVKVKHTVTFTDGDTILSVQEVESGDSAVPPEVPAKDWYVFDSWDGNYTNVKSDITVNAKWKLKQEYEYEVLEDGTAIITKYYGPKSEVEIPESIDGIVVSGIGNSVFAGNSNLTKVTIPKTVTSLEYEAFASCTNLTNVEFEEGSKLQAIGCGVFRACAKLETFKCPDDLQTIDSFAFNSCENLKSIQFNDGLKTIGKEVFAHSGLVSVTIPDSITQLGSTAFWDCKALEKAIIGKGIETIEFWTFAGCLELKQVELSNIKVIAPEAFVGCGLESIDLPDTLQAIETGAFQGSALKSIDIPDSVESISSYAFEGCKALTKVHIGNKLAYISEEAFANCGLESISIGSGTKEIGRLAFSDNQKLKEVSIPKNVVKIQYGSFKNCKQLETIELPETLESLGWQSFDGTKWYDDQKEGVLYIDKYVYGYKGDMPENATVEITEGKEFIAELAFFGYTNLKEVKIPESVTTISNYAFYDCSNMHSVFIPASVQKIGTRSIGFMESDEQNGEKWEYFDTGFHISGYCTKIPDFTIYGEAGSVAEVYAQENGLNFVKLKHTVTFKDGDTVLSTQEVESGADAVPPEVPAKEGYVFTGWDGDYTNVKSDIILTAKWSYKDGWSKDLTGNWFYYENGKMVTGWKQIGRDYYYLHEDGHMAADEWIGDYYIDVNGVWQQNIVRAKWMNSNGKWWYRNEDGSYPANAWKKIEEKWYYFDASGYSVTGWQQIGGLWYYFGTDRTMQTGWTQIGNQEYYFTSGGAMAVGWLQLAGKYYYFNSSGIKVKNAWVGSYYLKADGTMAVSEWVDNTYYVNADGIYQTGWLTLDGKWYYLNGSGTKQTGWIYISGTWYYGEPETGALLEKEWLNDTYYFYAGGAMATGWVQIDGTYYYCNAGGAKVKNAWVGNYYLKADGAMATNEWVDNDKYYVDENGVWDPNKVK